jgi:predicted secreted Zn-dependent protease
MLRRVLVRSILVPLPVVVLIVLSGCAGLPPTQQRELILLKTSRSTEYYSVRGTATGPIFDDIEKNGLFDAKARRAVGLTSGNWSIDWRGVDTHSILCSPESMTITLTLVITLPRHEQLNELSPDVRTNWQRFAARVAAHEQRHVDIYLNGAKAMKTRMEATLTKSSSCSELESGLRSIWASQQAETEKAQDQFHVDDEAEIQNDRKPLQVEIGINQTRVTTINSELRVLDHTLADLKRQRDETHARIDAVKGEMATSHASPAHCSQSQFTSQEIQTLCRQYRALVAANNALVDQHNGAISSRNGLTDEHNRVVAVTNGLIETLNWIR